jgi:cobalt-precorrin-6B (C15)-methyltransferase
MWTYKTPGIPDDSFLQSDKVPGPTKEEIRVLTMSKARLREGAIVIDVGCGTGGLTVEAALQVGMKGKIFAVDEDEEAVKLTTSNVKKFFVVRHQKQFVDCQKQMLSLLVVARIFMR